MRTPPCAAAEVFWTKVDKSAGPYGCWPWLLSLDPYGYGKAGPLIKAHRRAYELVNGPIPPSLSVCHHCDNRPCCNPAHLFAATLTENTADREAKGRGAKGEKNGIAKLTEGDIREIRECHRPGVYGLTRDIASRFGVSRELITKIAYRKAWGHVS